MKYSEIFYTIQGEGELAGTPSVFFRTSFCNLRCWWCDTPYTSWKPEDKDIEIEDAVKQIMDFGCKFIVITGGEPFIQSASLIKLCTALHIARADCHITIETNATVFQPVDAELISMSPKTANSIPLDDDKWTKKHTVSMWRPDVINEFMKHYNYQLKFVVDEADDVDEIEDLLEGLSGEHLILSKVMLMPQARTDEEIRDKEGLLIELCKAHGYRYSPRMHIDLWGNKRGV